MRTYDLSPLMRSTIGFDRISRLFEAATRLEDEAPSYPPYNIEKSGEDTYRITMAVAGFSPAELDVTVNQNTLVISGRQREDRKDATYLHRGIAARAFERRFDLADTVKVVDARLENGLLHVNLVREIPEAKKPRQIQIVADAPKAQTIEHAPEEKAEPSKAA
jgi:molecular chaperone IbpA